MEVAHLFILGLIVLIYPQSEIFGKTGTQLLFMTYFLIFLHSKTSLSTNLKTLFTTIIVCLILVEAAVPKIEKKGFDQRSNLKEWSDFVDGHNLHGGGYLKPNVNERIVAEVPNASFITNNHGFRNSQDVTLVKPKESTRILLIGDSFIAGYRTDQGDIIGSVLQKELSIATGEKVEVLNTGVHDTHWAGEYLDQHGMQFNADLVTVGITLGNDISGSFATEQNLSFREGIISETLLPPSAFDLSPVKALGLRLERSISKWRIVRLVRRILIPQSIASWYADYPGQVHAFDIIHSLGHYFIGTKLKPVERSFEALGRSLERIKNLTQSTQLLVVLFPQRFQTSMEDWDNTVHDYGLRRDQFDLLYPNRRVLEYCALLEISCVDLTQSISNTKVLDVYLPLGDMHFNRNGQRKAAKLLSAYISKTGYLAK